MWHKTKAADASFFVNGLFSVGCAFRVRKIYRFKVFRIRQTRGSLQYLMKKILFAISNEEDPVYIVCSSAANRLPSC